VFLYNDKLCPRREIARCCIIIGLYRNVVTYKIHNNLPKCFFTNTLTAFNHFLVLTFFTVFTLNDLVYYFITAFPLVPKLVTLNDLKRRNGRYFAVFYRSQ